MTDFANKVRNELPAFRVQYPEWTFEIEADVLLVITAGSYSRHVSLYMVRDCLLPISQVLRDECEHIERMLVIRERLTNRR